MAGGGWLWLSIVLASAGSGRFRGMVLANSRFTASRLMASVRSWCSSPSSSRVVRASGSPTGVSIGSRAGGCLPSAVTPPKSGLLPMSSREPPASRSASSRSSAACFITVGSGRSSPSEAREGTSPKVMVAAGGGVKPVCAGIWEVRSAAGGGGVAMPMMVALRAAANVARGAAAGTGSPGAVTGTSLVVFDTVSVSISDRSESSERRTVFTSSATRTTGRGGSLSKSRVESRAGVPAAGATFAAAGRGAGVGSGGGGRHAGDGRALGVALVGAAAPVLRPAWARAR